MKGPGRFRDRSGTRCRSSSVADLSVALSIKQRVKGAIVQFRCSACVIADACSSRSLPTTSTVPIAPCALANKVRSHEIRMRFLSRQTAMSSASDIAWSATTVSCPAALSQRASRASIPSHRIRTERHLERGDWVMCTGVAVGTVRANRSAGRRTYRLPRESLGN